MKKFFAIHKYLFIILLFILSFMNINECFALDGNEFMPNGPVGMGYIAEEVTASIIKKWTDEKKCRPVEKYKHEIKDTCTLCPLFALVFNAVSQVGAKSVTKFSSGVAKVVIVGFAIWLALQVLAFVSSIETQDLKDLIQKIITQGFIVMIVVIILDGGVGYFLGKFLTPVYNVGHTMSQSLLTNEATKAIKSEKGKAGKFIEAVPNGLPKEMGINIISTMTGIENEARKVKVLGSSFICMSKIKAKIFFLFTRLFWLGFLFWIFGLLLIFTIPFLMVDSVLKIGVVIALLPMAIGGYAFKYTRQYTKQVWDTLLNSTLSFLFITLVALLVISSVKVTVQDAVAEFAKGSFDSMFNPGNSAGETMFMSLVENFNVTSSPFTKICMIFILAWSVMQMGKDMAGDFSSSISNTSIGSDIATAGASAIKGTTLKFGKPVVGHAWNGVKEGAGNMASNIRGARFSRKQEAKINRFTNSANANGGSETGKNGVRQVYKNGALISTHADKKGREIENIDGKNISVTRIKNADGTYTEKVRVNEAMLHKAIKNNGSFNSEELDKILEGTSGEERKQLQAALMKKVVQKRVSEYAINYSKEKYAEPPEVVIDGNGEMQMRHVNTDGKTVFTKIKRHPNGMLETEVAIIDRNGKTEILTSDGHVNKIDKFRLNEGIDYSKITSLDSLKSDNYDKKNRQVGYSGNYNVRDGIIVNQDGHKNVGDYIKYSNNEFMNNRLRAHFNQKDKSLLAQIFS